MQLVSQLVFSREGAKIYTKDILYKRFRNITQMYELRQQWDPRKAKDSRL
jgi:hypothetical protein